MAEPRYVKILNTCKEKITVHFRFPRPKKQSATQPRSFVLAPGQSSHPLPFHFLVGAKGWEKLRLRECVQIETVAFEPRFVQIVNRSAASITLTVRPSKPAPRRKAALRVDAGEKSRTVDLRSISQRTRLTKLIAERQVQLIPVYDIGPTTGRGRAVASYADEDVYICFECGGPIVFRGSPPRPVHI